MAPSRLNQFVSISSCIDESQTENIAGRVHRLDQKINNILNSHMSVHFVVNIPLILMFQLRQEVLLTAETFNFVKIYCSHNL